MSMSLKVNGRAVSRRRRARRGGFTLMEVLLVLAILVILGATAVFSFSNVFAGSKVKAARVAVDNFETAISIFEASEGRYPQDLNELWTPSANNANRPYVTVPQGPDPWGQQYGYEPGDATQGVPYRIWSNGPDGQSGSQDDIVSNQ